MCATTHVRGHVLRAFLKPEAGFVPDGEYGLDPKANRKVAAALRAFCQAANQAARRDGLATFEQRLTAFQDTSVVGVGGATSEDYFGIIGLDSASSPASSVDARSKQEPARRGLTFAWKGSLDDLFTALNGVGDWGWFALRQYRIPFLESHPGNGLWGKIRSAKEPARGFIALLEAEPEANTGIDDLVGRFRIVLAKLKVRRIKEVDAATW